MQQTSNCFSTHKTNRFDYISQQPSYDDFIDFLPEKTGIDPKKYPGQLHEDDRYYPSLKANPHNFFQLAYAANETISEQNIFESNKDSALWRELVLELGDPKCQLDNEGIKKLFANPPVSYFAYLKGCKYRERYFLNKAQEFRKLLQKYQKPYREFKHLLSPQDAISM